MRSAIAVLLVMMFLFFLRRDISFTQSGVTEVCIETSRVGGCGRAKQGEGGRWRRSFGGFIGSVCEVFFLFRSGGLARCELSLLSLELASCDVFG